MYLYSISPLRSLYLLRILHSDSYNRNFCFLEVYINQRLRDKIRVLSTECPLYSLTLLNELIFDCMTEVIIRLVNTIEKYNSHP